MKLKWLDSTYFQAKENRARLRGHGLCHVVGQRSEAEHRANPASTENFLRKAGDALLRKEDNLGGLGNMNNESTNGVLLCFGNI